MKLSYLCRLAAVPAAGLEVDTEVVLPVDDSRDVQTGDLFFSMPSPTEKAIRFLNDAVANGAAAAVVLSSPLAEACKELGLPHVLLGGVKFDQFKACGDLAHALLGYPTREMRVLGITGTNGKTTTAWIVRDMLAAIGESSAYLGTLGYSDSTTSFELPNTTPFPVKLARLLADAWANGVTSLAMEVSSHALEEGRVESVEFDAAVFTNLTQDHLDFHGTLKAYEEAKLRLFQELPERSRKNFVGAVNLDDPVGASWYESIQRPLIGFSLESSYGAEVIVGIPVKVGASQISMQFSYRGATSPEVTLSLGGNFNVSNALTAVAALVSLGCPFFEAVASLSAVHPVPGRFEPVKNSKGLEVIVDYAHTPDALEKLLDSVHALSPMRTVTVFGCGGDRDPIKRPLMANAASRRSDFTIVTSDNPRTEDPEMIIQDVVRGIEPGAKFTAIIDRPTAIRHAIAYAKPGDVVVIAGKGHENYQIIGHTKIHMDDRELAQLAIEAKP